MTPRRRSLASRYLRRRYTVLFFSLLLTLGAAPLLEALEMRGGALKLFLILNLAAAAAGGGARARRVLAVLVVAVVALHAVALGLRSPALASVALVLWSAVALLATASAVRFALRGPVVQTEHVHAALSAYLLAGVFAGVLYFALEHEAPGSLLAPDASPGTLTLPSAIYFSFVTLATVGYGDIVPRTDLARGLAIFEATAGQLYLVVMVARLVSLHARSDERAR